MYTFTTENGVTTTEVKPNIIGKIPVVLYQQDKPDWDSVQHLIENGVIVGSGFHVNPKSLGYTTCTYVGLNLERGSMYRNVVEQINTIPEVIECHFTTGSYTMLVKLFAKDNEQLMDLLNNKIQSIPGVVSTETLISLEQSIKREIPITE